MRQRIDALRSASTPVRGELVECVDDFVAAIGRWGDDPGDADELERLAAQAFEVCGGIRPRDLLLRALTAEGDRDLLVHARAVLGEAVRCAPAGRLAPVATVLAVCAWVCGAGATARVALDRALEGDPAYSLAGLVSAALDAGTPPWTWASMMADITVEEILASGGGARVRDAMASVEADVEGAADGGATSV